MQMKQCVIFGNRLKDLRNKINITQLELSEELKIQRVTIAKYEKGERAPTIDHLIALADFFKVTTDYLLGRTDIDEMNAEDKQFISDKTGMSKEMINKLMIMKQENCSLMLDTINLLFNHSNYLKIVSELLRLQAVCADLSDCKAEHFKFDSDMLDMNNECILRNYQLSMLFKEIIDTFDTRQTKNEFFFADSNITAYGESSALMIDEFHRFTIKMHNMGLNLTKEVSDNGKHNPEEE
ncbi:MAG: helix-turn-helix transcriptional regulator [Oscillospiraceae bacterium]|nr:helix-turn-helix transcriptional regulator [Oscillospiraceae bacterium]